MTLPGLPTVRSWFMTLVVTCYICAEILDAES